MKPRWIAFALPAAAACAHAQSPTIDKMRKTGVVSIGYIDGALPFSFLLGIPRPGDGCVSPRRGDMSSGAFNANFSEDMPTRRLHDSDRDGQHASG